MAGLARNFPARERRKKGDCLLVGVFTIASIREEISQLPPKVDLGFTAKILSSVAGGIINRSAQTYCTAFRVWAMSEFYGNGNSHKGS